MRNAVLRICLIIFPLLAMHVHGFAQGERKVTISKFSLHENVSENDVLGLELTFDAIFNWVEDMSNRSFTVDCRLEQQGKTILPNQNYPQPSTSVFASSQTVQGKTGMAATGNKIFIPYHSIPLTSGSQTVDFIFTAYNSEGKYSDCFKKSVTFTHKQIILHAASEQGFTFSNFQVNYGAKAFSSEVPGMEINATVDFKYSKQESADDRYEVAMLLRGAGGKIFFDSRKSVHGSDEIVKLYLETVEGKPRTQLKFFASYYDVALEAPGEVEIVYVLLGAEGGPKEIAVHKMLLNIPPSYKFEDQKFTAQSVKFTPATVDGVRGIAVDYSVAFSQTGIMRNYEKGKYYFYPVILDQSNKIVIAPERAATQGAGTTHLQDGQMPGADNTVAKGKLFVPLHLLNLPQGTHSLKYALMVSDINLTTKFPVISTGAIEITKPADHRYTLSLEQLDMINANYDVEVVPVSSNLPELQYAFAVGEDHYYESEYVRNSLSAIPGSATLHLCEGDPINLVLIDVDSGFFNDSDELGSWKIDYIGKGNSFYYEIKNAGQVVTLRLKVTQVN